MTGRQRIPDCRKLAVALAVLRCVQNGHRLCGKPLRAGASESLLIPADDLLLVAQHTLSAIKQGAVPRADVAFCWRQLKLSQWELDDHEKHLDADMLARFQTDIGAVEELARQFHAQSATGTLDSATPKWLHDLIQGATTSYAAQVCFKAVSSVALNSGLPWALVTFALFKGEDSDMLSTLENVYKDLYADTEKDEWCGLIPDKPESFVSATQDMLRECLILGCMLT